MIALDHPYPTRLIDRWRLRDGRRLTVRPVLPQDAALEQSLVRGLSPEARYNRFFNPLRELSARQLEEMTQIDYRRHVALVAEHFVRAEPRVVAEARYVVDDNSRAAEFAVIVADDWHRLGIGRRLVCMLARHARHAGLATLYGDVLASNTAMLELLKRLGFARRMHSGDARLVRAVLDVQAPLRRPVPRPWGAALLPAL